MKNEGILNFSALQDIGVASHTTCSWWWVKPGILDMIHIPGPVGP